MRVLAHGWYGRGNVGDEAFRPALQQVLGDVTIDYTSDVKSVDGYDLLVVGGGSFLDQPLKIRFPPEELKIPLAFLGIGLHGIHPDNRAWLDKATVVVARHNNDYEGVLVGPDLVFARDLSPTTSPVERKLLVLPNGFAIPRRESPAWAVSAWQAFTVAMGKTIDDFLSNGWQVSIQPMCAETVCHSRHDDRLAGAHLLGMVEHTTNIELGLQPLSEATFVDAVSSASLVLSARLHGCIFSALLGTPFVGISAHDKVKSFFEDLEWDNWADYYGLTQKSIQLAVEQMPSAAAMQSTRERGFERWQELSVIVRERLSL